MAYAWVGGGRGGLYMWRVAANILNSWWGWGGGPPAWVLGNVLAVPHLKKLTCYKMLTKPQTWTDTLD